MTRNEQYWIDRANRRMDGYILSAEEQAKVIQRSYNRTRAYVQSEMEKILHHIGDEGSLAYEYRMKRLAALLKNTEKKMTELYGVTLEDTTEFLKSIVPEAYYHTIFDIAQGTGIEPEFSAVNQKLIDSVVKEPWSGKNYSKRIWANTDKLADEVREVMTQAAMSGESINKTSRKLADAFNTSSYNAERLIRTETTYACNQAELASYNELDIDRYKFVATLDTRTSPICQKMDGKIFETDKAQAGKNLPAMHPNCRSTTIPYFEDFEPTERAARDADGNPITVPANMTYPEWYDKYVKPKEEQKVPKTPSKVPEGNNTPSSKPTPQKPQKTPESKPAEIDIPGTDIKPDYTETPIPKHLVEVPRPEPTAPAIKPEKKPSNRTKPIDKTAENDIIDVGRKASAPNMKPPDFDKYEVKEDKSAVQKAKDFIINVLGVAADKVNLDGIKNADVLEPFFKRMQKAIEKYSIKMPPIKALDIIDGDPNCIAEYDQYKSVLFISIKFFNSKEATLATLKEWVNDKLMPEPMKTIAYVAEHEAAHILIPDKLLKSEAAAKLYRQFKKTKYANFNDDKNVYEFFADSVAWYRISPQTLPAKMREAIEFLMKEGIL